MANVPHAILSEALQERIGARRLKAAVFLTYEFDPSFFEEEVLPVLLDVPLSHSPTARLLQLDDVLRTTGAQISVYYDPGALRADRSARLDIRRVPVRHRTGYFHPKNVLALVEKPAETGDDHPRETLIVTAMSANLTRNGWWENVEVCHIEEIDADGKSGFRDDLLDLCRRLRAEVPPETEDDALEAIRKFVLRVAQYDQRSGGGTLHPRFYAGAGSFVDFLKESAGSRLSDLNLEIISPFFDDADEVRPLADLISAFGPREVRVFLPLDDAGTAGCSERLHRALDKLPGCRWGRLPGDLLRLGKAENAGNRRVHAKVYRFFSNRPRYEAFFVGSPNLTGPGFSRGGNFETGFLLETEPAESPDWWLSIERKRPVNFVAAEEGQDPASGAGLALALRYDWSAKHGSAYWDQAEASPRLGMEANGVALFPLESLPPRRWVDLGEEAATVLARVLVGTSFLQVRVDGAEPTTILVQEEGMSHKPSLLLTLSAADILKSWALLKPEQRAAFIEQRAAEIAQVARELGLDIIPPPEGDVRSFFERFAGIFHAFGCLQRAVFEALKEGREKEAIYRLFGRKYDSLPNLLDRVLAEEAKEDDVTRYVILLCARQLVQLVHREHPDFFRQHRDDVDELEKRLGRLDEVRARFTFEEAERRTRFFEWFDRWFLTQAVTDVVR